MTRKCPGCGAEDRDGRFCSECGVALDGAACPECGNSLPEGARFCNGCGAPIARPTPAARSAGGATTLPWVIAGLALIAVLAMLFIPRGGDSPDPTAAAPISSGDSEALDPSSIDISSMTPRERADRLFNRVMTAASTGDTTQARAFVPMALAAYGQLPEVDLDARYHRAVLQLVASDPTAARAEADSILQTEPDHLFGLFTAAQAEDALGNTAAADDLYRRFLDVYPDQVDRPLAEYQDHARVLPVNREYAEERVGGG